MKEKKRNRDGGTGQHGRSELVNKEFPAYGEPAQVDPGVEGAGGGAAVEPGGAAVQVPEGQAGVEGRGRVD